MPRMPWRWIVLGVAAFSIVGGGYWLKEKRRAEQLRAEIVRVRDTELRETSERYVAFRDKLEGWILQAAASKPDHWADERLNLSGLRAGDGLYLRLPAKGKLTKKAIDEGARMMQPDAIARCLGLAPASARGLWEQGGFLLPDWVQDARKETSVMRLRVIDEMLARNIRSSLPTVLSLMRSHWFMLVLERGDNRRDGPVDVVLWDIRRETMLMKARVQANGMLVPVRIASKGIKPAPRRSVVFDSGGAADCSIAAQLKQLTGAPAAAMGFAPDAGAPDGGVPDGGVPDASAGEPPPEPASEHKHEPKAAPSVTPDAPPSSTPDAPPSATPDAP
jgi:hypothetical protein